MSTPATPASSTWKVTGQNQVTEIAPGGTPTQGVRVYYTTGAGQSGSVFVPMAKYTPEGVAAAVAEAAATMDAIGSLTSG